MSHHLIADPQAHHSRKAAVRISQLFGGSTSCRGGTGTTNGIVSAPGVSAAPLPCQCPVSATCHGHRDQVGIVAYVAPDMLIAQFVTTTPGAEVVR